MIVHFQQNRKTHLPIMIVLENWYNPTLELMDLYDFIPMCGWSQFSHVDRLLKVNHEILRVLILFDTLIRLL
jgi:hypothetical protein